MKTKFNETLCANNIHVKTLLNSIKRGLKSIKKNGIETDRLLEQLNEALECLREMKKQGQHIENRCRKYRYAIESLGFERKTKIDLYARTKRSS